MGKIPLTGYRCDRCSHEWIPRNILASRKADPVICPSCKSPYWDKPRREKKKK